MELTIGRGEPSMQLCITSGKVKMLYGNEGSVARSVSRAHCKLTITDTGNIILENLKPENVTFVNGMAIVSKRINGNENVALGGDRYPLNWEYVNDFIQKVKDSAPKKCDLRPLKQVYETYHNATIQLNKNERLFNSLGRGIPILTITGSVLGAMLGGQKVLIFSIIAAVLSAIIFLKSLVDSSKIVHKRDELSHQFMHDYTCPLCGHFFGNYPYDIVTKNYKKCPGCGAEILK